MTTAQTTQMPTQAQMEAGIKNLEKALKNSVEKKFDWAGLGKSVGLFAVGAAVGAAGKLAWDHFVG